MTRRLNRPMLVAIALVVPVATVAAAQVRRQPGAVQSQVKLTVDLSVGGDILKLSGDGKCTHAPQASIYNVKSQMRTARLGDAQRSVQLTWWDPADGSEDMVNLVVNTGSSSRSVSTVRGGQPSGSATVTFEPSGKGGTFSVKAKAADGAAVTGTISCDAFTPHVAEGG